jgi:hypothetical protein
VCRVGRNGRADGVRAVTIPGNVRLLVRTAVGLALLAGGLTFFAYGISQAIENGSCGSSSQGRSFGPACPSGFGPMIMLMILGVFMALAGGAVFGTRQPLGTGRGVAGGVGRFFLAGTVVIVAAIVFAIVDLHPDDTRPGLEIVAVVVAAVLLIALPGLVRGPARAPAVGSPLSAGAASAAASSVSAALGLTPKPADPHAAARAQDVAARLKQLEQLRDSGLVGSDEYAERRKQILAEL